MAKFVYLAGPITGQTYEGSTSWREEVARALAPGIVGVSPMRLKEWCKQYGKSIPHHYEGDLDTDTYLLSGEPHAIAARDFHDVRICDAIFAYLPMSPYGLSLGTVMELGWASALRKPTVIVTDDEKVSQHPLLRVQPCWILPDIDLGIAAINSILSIYTQETDNG